MHNQACRVVRYGTITVCTVRTVLVKLRRTTVFVTPYFTVITVVYGTVYGTVPSWHCQCKNGLRKASPPQTPPISTSSMLPLWADATQCVPERPWGWVGATSARGRAQQWLAWKLKVGRSTWFLVIICVLFMTNCCKKTRNVLGRNWSQTANLRSTSCCMVAPYCTVGHRLFKQTVLAPYCMAYYGTVL